MGSSLEIAMKIEKLEAIISTGLPGAYRVLVFLAIQTLFSVGYLGNIASWFTTAQILGFFTAIGWSSLILTRIPRLKEKREKNIELNKLIISAAITTLLIIISLSIILILAKKTDQILGISILLIGWTIYQIPRHYLIAEKKYRKAIAFDLALLVSTIALISIAQNERDISFAISGSLLFIGLTLYLTLQAGSFGKITNLNLDLRGIEFGLSNFLTGGVSLSIIPIANVLEGKELTGSISLFLSISSISLLIPRALSLNNLPGLTIELNKKERGLRELKDLKLKITQSNILISLLSLPLAIGVYLISKNENLFTTFLIIASILILQSAISTQSIISSNVLMCLEKSKDSLKINAISFLIYATTSLLSVMFLPPSYKLIGVCIALVISTSVRLVQLNKHSRKLLCQ